MILAALGSEWIPWAFAAAGGVAAMLTAIAAMFSMRSDRTRNFTDAAVNLIEPLQQQQERLQNKVAALEAETTGLHCEIAELKEENRVLRERVRGLEAENQALRERLEANGIPAGDGR